MELKVETWPIERLVEYARNPRKNDEQVERMKPYMELRVPKSACQFMRDLDGLKEIGKSLYGNGFFLAKAEARAKAEAAKLRKIALSEREREIVEKLG